MPGGKVLGHTSPNEPSPLARQVFPLLRLRIRPTRGMAVVHFPTRVDAGGAYAADRRVLHEGRPAVDEKWLLATWVWASAVQPEWGDGSIEALGGGEI